MDLTLAQSDSPTQTLERDRIWLSRRWVALCWLAVFVCGALQAWDIRPAIDPDGVTNLDIGDAFFHGNWRLAINGVFAPLYPFLIGLTNWIVRPPPRLEYVVLHGLNLLIYLAAYGALLFLIVELIRDQHGTAEQHRSQPALPDNTWLLLGTAIFIWAALTLATINEETPDILAAVFIFVAFACLLRIRRGQGGWGTFVVLGAALGLGYLSKFFMFGMAFVFIAVALAATGAPRRSLARGLVALATFLLLAGPYVYALSRQYGYFTTNNSGTINYLITIDHVPFVNWQGGPPGTGTLLHPTRQLYQAPAVYEYASPISGTYPPWDDPAYWFAGGTPKLDIGAQIDVLLTEAAPIYLNMFVLSSAALLAGSLILYALTGTWRQALLGLARQWVLLVPALAALALFAAIHVESRYAVAFATVFWLGVLAGIRLPTASTLRPAAARIASVAALVMVLVAGLPPALNSLTTAREWLRGRNPQPAGQWAVASALHQLGIPEHDTIAVMGDAFRDAPWARQARVQIVAEIPLDQENAFWALDSTRQAEVIHLLAGSGAHVLVTKLLPSTAPGAWKRLGQTDYYAYWLR